MKYKPDFERDFKWYLSVRHSFNFDGKAEYTNKKGKDIIIYDKNGVDGKLAFFKWDSNGLILPTKHPNILHTLLKTKGSVNLHIKMYAESLKEESLNLELLEEICQEFKTPEWFKNAVKQQIK